MKEKTQNDFYMEDVHSLALKAFAVIEEGLREYGIELEDGEDDEIYIPIDEFIEKFCVGDYRNHN